MSEESHAAAQSDDPPETFVLDFIHSGGMLDFRPLPVPSDTPEPDEVIDPKASSALESVESSPSTETTETVSSDESSVSPGPFASVGKVSTPFKEAEPTGSQTS